jgi:hypothetical protein
VARASVLAAAAVSLNRRQVAAVLPGSSRSERRSCSAAAGVPAHSDIVTDDNPESLVTFVFPAGYVEHLAREVVSEPG